MGRSKAKPNEAVHHADGTTSIIVESVKFGRMRFVVSTPDYILVRGHRYFASEGYGYSFYAKRNEGNTTRRMHNDIMQHVPNGTSGSTVDHVDRDTMNNRRSNLRVVDQSEQARNRKQFRNNTSGRVGVYLRPNGSWRAMISIQGSVTHLGTFKTLEEAVAARGAAERRYWCH